MDESAKPQIGERLRLFRETKKMSQAQMAEALGGATPGLQKNELGLTLPNSKLLASLYGLGLNVNWLLSGEGPMLLADLHAASDVGPADLHAYGECLEILEMALNKSRRTLSPEKKRAAVDALYRAWEREKRFAPQVVDMLMQLAA